MAGARRRTPHSSSRTPLGAAAALPLMGAFLLASGEAKAEDRPVLAVTSPPPVEQALDERPEAAAVDTAAFEGAAGSFPGLIAQASPAPVETTPASAPAPAESAAPAAEAAPPALARVKRA